MLQKKRLIFACVSIIPVMAIRLLTTIYPVVMAGYYSLLNYDLINQSKSWNFPENYLRLPNDTMFVDSLEFTLIYTIASVSLFIVFGILLALLMKQDFPGRKLIRTVTLIPWAMPMIIVAIAASWAFNDTYGIINDLIRRTIIPDFHMHWLTNTVSSRISVILVNVWKNAPFFAILMLAAFQGIPTELYESARIAGAGAFKSFFSITLPCSLRTLIMTSMFNIIWSVNGFDIVYAMTKGGPGTSTSLLAYKVYMESLRNLNYGVASAVTVVMVAVSAFFAIIGMRTLRKIDY